MAIILALNGFNVLTGEPKEDPERNDCEHHDNHHGEYHGGYNFDWIKSAKAVSVEHKIKYVYFDAQDLPFPDKSFNGIFMYDTLQHIQNKEVALNECIRVLKPNGVISVIEWNKKQIEEDYKKYGFKIDFMDPRNFISRDDIKVEVFT